ncbi:histidine kinase [Undibacterium cyanobacteriorum]|uniref:Histidine kinase n=1 Tax=Undibacterium cyanobacteriorum TaxID=3073561 RepID=A0ABY9RP30_9BURK|nr:histidine kinase [Undibacterium sp. 20NA77.5]WMW82197.1 histidine kinase [Undibacterium sp. 20NA77.5]
MMKFTWASWWITIYVRLILIGMMQLAAFGIVERWPKRFPAWAARWVFQVAAVAVVVPFAAALAYSLTTIGEPVPWYTVQKKIDGFGEMVGAGLLFSPWIAMAALYRQISGQAQRQALAFELERSELARDALDSRLRLLQAQVEPHFLFNTLANVRELVDSGSPQASKVLGSLIAYLRAAVPNLNSAASTLGQELDLVRAYLELMYMRMPDRLQFSIDVDEATLQIPCPPMSLLTLVENAIRHGIDPSEEGGRIDISVFMQADRCVAQVSDTGVGMGVTHVSKGLGAGLGTGLVNLQERLQLVFGEHAHLSLSAIEPHGFLAEINLPVKLESSIHTSS